MQINSWSELESTVFPTCEVLVSTVKELASRLASVSLTITHKSRNTPHKQPNQFRGCIVLNCLKFDDPTNPCSFEIKGYGLIQGGWKIRPIQLLPNNNNSKKGVISSWIQCNHSKEPLRIEPIDQSTDWNQLLEVSFLMPDDFISAATRLAHLESMNLELLTLMLSDGLPKSNGRDSTYIPRGFLTLQCLHAGEGCPVVIKAREESDGWYMRPWRQRGKGDLKGAVSIIVCKHGEEVKTAHLAQVAAKEAKEAKEKLEKESRPKVERIKKTKPVLDLPTTPKVVKKRVKKVPTTATNTITGEEEDSTKNITLAAIENMNAALSNPDLVNLLQGSHHHLNHNLNHNNEVEDELVHYTNSLITTTAENIFNTSDYIDIDPYATFPNIDHHHHLHQQQHSPIASTSNHIFSSHLQQSPTSAIVSSTLQQFTYHPNLLTEEEDLVELESNPNTNLLDLSIQPIPSSLIHSTLPSTITDTISSLLPPSVLKRSGEKTTLESRAPKRIRIRRKIKVTPTTTNFTTTSPPLMLEKEKRLNDWKVFLNKLDPQGRLNHLAEKMICVTGIQGEGREGMEEAEKDLEIDELESNPSYSPIKTSSFITSTSTAQPKSTKLRPSAGTSEGISRGLDPETILDWSEERVQTVLEKEFLNSQEGGDNNLLLFRILLGNEGKRVWEEMKREKEEVGEAGGGL